MVPMCVIQDENDKLQSQEDQSSFHFFSHYIYLGVFLGNSNYCILSKGFFMFPSLVCVCVYSVHVGLCLQDSLLEAGAIINRIL